MNARVSFGMFVENMYTASDDISSRLSEHREQVALARNAGFKSIVFGQHMLAEPIHMLAPIPHMASLISESGEMNIVAGVLVLPLLNPIVIAEDLASLDWLCGGRLTMGVGLGYRDIEYEALGVAKATRVARFNEVFEAIRANWTSTDRWSYRGKYFSYDGLPPGLKPMQRPYPPVWFAADVESSVKRAGRWGAAWYVSPRASLDTVRNLLPTYRASLVEHGHDLPKVFPMRREAVLAVSDAEAAEIAVRHLQTQLRLYESWGQYRGMPDAGERNIAFSAKDIPDTYLVGTPEQVGDLIETYAEQVGVNHIVLRMQWPGTPQSVVLRSIELVGERLIPRFQATAAA